VNPLFFLIIFFFKRLPVYIRKAEFEQVEFFTFKQKGHGKKFPVARARKLGACPRIGKNGEMRDKGELIPERFMRNDVMKRGHNGEEIFYGNIRE